MQPEYILGIGPPFLRQNGNNWPGVKGVEMEVLTDDPELRREAKSYATIAHKIRGKNSQFAKIKKNRCSGVML